MKVQKSEQAQGNILRRLRCSTRPELQIGVSLALGAESFLLYNRPEVITSRFPEITPLVEISAVVRPPEAMQTLSYILLGIVALDGIRRFSAESIPYYVAWYRVFVQGNHMVDQNTD